MACNTLRSSRKNPGLIEVGTRGERGRFDLGIITLPFLAGKDELSGNLYDAQGNDRGDVNVARSYHQGIEAGLGH